MFEQLYAELVYSYLLAIVSYRLTKKQGIHMAEDLIRQHETRFRSCLAEKCKHWSIQRLGRDLHDRARVTAESVYQLLLSQPYSLIEKRLAVIKHPANKEKILQIVKLALEIDSTKT